MDTGKVNLDLKRFVEQKVEDIAETNRWDRQLKGDVEEYINSRVGGTFIWVSLALKVASEELPYQVLPKLKELPQGPKELYVRKFNELSDKTMAIRVLSLVIAAGEDPMSLDELAMALLFHPQALPRSNLPSDQEIRDARNWPQSFAILLRISRDPHDAKVNLIHLTVQEFMEDSELDPSLSHFRIDRAKAESWMTVSLSSQPRYRRAGSYRP
ncbi:hypothetical protein Slin15195_G064040 [Septoria linicola]|uniref:Uncharacterized protein n=1 Tax=Septoria linicola TaxID=215465 RepID=A0A9Q9EJJ2_9PEZI|nr:hypothetical protein Slin14017_G114360 [Septoria linicola]USW53085.1 hypothetical protein Slin15195_G064040 [Septoria linicola]